MVRNFSINLRWMIRHRRPIPGATNQGSIGRVGHGQFGRVKTNSIERPIWHRKPLARHTTICPRKIRVREQFHRSFATKSSVSSTRISNGNSPAFARSIKFSNWRISWSIIPKRVVATWTSASATRRRVFNPSRSATHLEIKSRNWCFIGKLYDAWRDDTKFFLRWRQNKDAINSTVKTPIQNPNKPNTITLMMYWYSPSITTPVRTTKTFGRVRVNHRPRKSTTGPWFCDHPIRPVRPGRFV